MDKGSKLSAVDEPAVFKEKPASVFKKKYLFWSFGITLIGALLVYVHCLRRTNLDTRQTSKLSGRIRLSHSLLNVSKAAVACENQICALIGTNVLALGGSAVDGAIAATFCIGVTNPQSSGIGGGGFLLVRTADGASDFLDFREEAPAAAFETMFGNNSHSSRNGGLSVAIPGEVKGLYEAWKRYGKLPWKQLVMPSVNLARVGVPISKKLGEALKEHSRLVLNDTAWRTVFANDEGTRVLNAGELYSNKQLADTLESVALNGADKFYEGEIAQQIAATVQARGGVLRAQDLQQYEAIWREPLKTFYKDYGVLTSPPPGSGSILLLMLNLIEQLSFNPQKMDTVDYHTLTEVMKFGYAFHKSLGDPNFSDDVNENVGHIISKKLAAKLAPKVHRGHTHNSSYYDPKGHNALKTSTMHVSVIDEHGNAASLTSTVNLLFGSKVLCPQTGVILNNQMDDFSSPLFDNFFGYPPSVYNFIKPKKRPLSSTVPTIVYNQASNEVELVVGASGGSLITSSVLLTLFRILEYKLDPFTAISSTRFHNQLYPPVTLYEPTLPLEVLDGAFASKRHNTSLFPTADGVSFSGVSAVQRINGRILASGDYRKWGASAGY